MYCILKRRGRGGGRRHSLVDISPRSAAPLATLPGAILTSAFENDFVYVGYFMPDMVWYRFVGSRTAQQGRTLVVCSILQPKS